MITLYQFPISHFSEKVRWTLDHKNIAYKKKNLLPGPHVKAIKKIAERSSVPVIVDGDKVVQGSSDIISYLDDKFPDKALTPVDSGTKAEALAWEEEADAEVGINVRVVSYHYLLDHPAILIPFFSQGGPWYRKPLLRIIFPKLAPRFRAYMNINEEAAKASAVRLRSVAEKMLSRLRQHDFLAGEAFSRADVAAASLWAPLARPQGYGLDWPSRYPEPLEELRLEFDEILRWVHRVYQNHR